MKKERMEKIGKTFLDEDLLKDLPIASSKSRDDDDEDEETPIYKSGATSSNTPALDSFSRDLTDLANKGKLDPIVGRDSEIERV